MFKIGRFTRNERVKRSAEIKCIFKNGEKVSAKGAKLFLLENGTQKNRVAFALSKGYGNAVERNYSKRLSREAFRLMKTKIKLGYDLVFLVYPGNDDYKKRCNVYEYLLNKAGIYENL